MSEGSISRRWAKAFLQIAKQENKVDAFLLEIEGFASVLKTSAPLWHLMIDPAFDSRERKDGLKAISTQLSLSPSTVHFLSFLIERDRISLFPEILIAYREMADEVLGRVQVEVRVADDALTAAAQEKLKSVLKKVSGREPVLQIVHDANLLGGMVLKIEDTVYDGSVRSSLEQIKEKMMRASVS